MCQPHKHAALIKAWADGAKIEVRACSTGKWRECDPSWMTSNEYRVKPEPKPDVVKYGYRDVHGMIAHTYLRPDTNVKYTFDGETGKLKSVELIGE